MRSVSARHGSHSSSARPSSIETSGYLSTSAAQNSIISSPESVRPSPSSVRAVDEELGRGGVHRDGDAVPVARRLGRLEHASIAASVEGRSGAKPPSSPTAVASPRSSSSFASVWKTSTATRSASENVSAPAGTTMNSCRSSELPRMRAAVDHVEHRDGQHVRACAADPAVQRHAGAAAAAFAAASERAEDRVRAEARLVLRPVELDQRRIDARAGRRRRRRGAPAAISSSTLRTACETPLPSQASPPSRSSSASCLPVDAPEGTAARPTAPPSSSTSTSTVGFPASRGSAARGRP